MSELFIKDYLKKVTLLEEQIGAKTKYEILEPFSINSRDIIARQEAAKKIAEFVGLHGLIFIVAIAEQKENVGGHIEFKDGEKEVFIEISDDTVEFEEAVLATLAHEITHIYMHINGISSGTGPIYEYENEVFTDITSVFLGLGKLMLNGCEVKKIYLEGSKTLKIGYLNRKQIAFVYRLVCAMRRISNHDMISGLSSEALSAIRACDFYQQDYFNPQFHTETYRNGIIETLKEDIQTLQGELNQVSQHLDFLKKEYVSKTEEFLEAKHKEIVSLLNDLKSMRQDNIYDPALLFLNTIELTKRIDQLRTKVRQEIFDTTKMKQNLNELTKLHQEEPQRLSNMENKKPSEWNNGSILLIRKIVYLFTIFAPSLCIFLLMVYLVFHAFAEGIYPGIRSLTGVLLPLILVISIFKFHKELLEKLGKIPTFISFLASLVVGLIVMMTIRFFAYSSAVPIPELVLSGSFSMLVFRYASLPENKILSYYYGMISGFLIYIIFFGFPVLR